jgi:hypothetical protein
MKKVLLLLPFIIFVHWGLGSGTFSEKWLRPTEEFRPLPKETDLNYADKKSWAARPDFYHQGFWPLNEGKVQKDLEVDVFYIHPTAYWSRRAWNFDLKSSRSTLKRIDSMLSHQASIFNQCCRLYAPHYREATLWSFYRKDTIMGRKALDFAYKDIKRAFDYFIDHYNKGRPFILVSHSQGTAHAMKLIWERIDGSILQKKFVAGYLLGYKLPLDYFKRMSKKIRPCQSKTETQCLIHWDSFEPGGVLSNRRGLHWYPSGWEFADNKKVLCTNPLSWRLDNKRVGEEKHQGLASSLSEKNIKIAPQQVWAQCEKGRLFVKALDDFGLKSWRFINWARGRKDNNLHLLDFKLFYQDIKRNAHERIKAYWALQAQKD